MPEAAQVKVKQTPASPTPPTAGPKAEPKVASAPTGVATEAVEQVKNCPACKKPLKKARRYYRNGAYYCSINCFKKAKAAKAGEGLKSSPIAEAKQTKG